MKRTAITIAMLGFAAVSTNAFAEASEGNMSAEVKLSHDVPLVCNIGLLATGDFDASVGVVDGLSANHNKRLELNDFTGKTSQPISGAVKCNANDGYYISVNLTNGALFNSDAAKSIGYTLKAEKKSGPSLVAAIPSPSVAAAANIDSVFTSGPEMAEQQFRLTLTPTDSFDDAPAGIYSEIITFSLTAL